MYMRISKICLVTSLTQGGNIIKGIRSARNSFTLLKDKGKE